MIINDFNYFSKGNFVSIPSCLSFKICLKIESEGFRRSRIKVKEYLIRIFYSPAPCAPGYMPRYACWLKSRNGSKSIPLNRRITLPLKPFHKDYTANLLRPLARLLLRTFRPPVVLLLSRKPCVLLRFIL